MRMARIATSSSGNGVEAASTIADWTEIHDFKAKLIKRNKPCREALSAQGPMDNVNNGWPAMVNSSGNAARTKGKASAARLSTKPTPRSDKTTTDKISAHSRM